MIDNIALLWKVAQQAYKWILRDVLRKAIDDPDEEWDDILMAVADAAFSMDGLNYEQAFEFAKGIYKETIRPVAEHAVRKTDTPFDDWALAVCDKIFA